MNKVICSRFGGKLKSSSDIDRRILSMPPPKNKREKKEIFPISTNGDEVFDGSVKTLDDFFNEAKKSKRTYFVLTDKEFSFLLRWSILFKVSLKSLESSFPIFSDIKYSNDLGFSFEVLKSKINLLLRYGVSLNGFYENSLSKNKKTIYRKHRLKTNYDEIFMHSYLPPYQEVFKFSEFRKDKLVIALDFNSMFSHCMEGDFLDPSSIYHKEINDNYTDKIIQSGFYHVVFKKPTSEFFNKYHPFKCTNLGLSLSFESESNTEIEVRVFLFELKYYAKFFEEVYIYSALLSLKEVGHPLYKESKRLYKKRIKAKKESKKELERYYKFMLASLHSVTNIRKTKSIDFETGEVFLKTIGDVFNVDFFGKGCTLYKYSPLMKKIKILSFRNYDKAVFPDLSNAGTIFSFSTQVLAKSKLKIFKTIETLKKIKGLDVCYVNTDSIHISIDRSSYDFLMSEIDSVVGDEMGQLKVQAVSHYASWFDVGHYYLLNDGEVFVEKSSSLSGKSKRKSFVDYKTLPAVFEDSEVNFLFNKTITIKSVLSYKKIFNSNDMSYVRFKLEDISNFDLAYEKIIEEKKQSSDFKLSYFKSLKGYFS
ncbi:hypothetical protein ACUM5Y_10710 [Marinomonas dokdonensis]|uniref:hypothetical protein n=1 Tax=Marinomonas dokdonensis TaxID=328224 RepID=UPI00405565FF